MEALKKIYTLETAPLSEARKATTVKMPLAQRIVRFGFGTIGRLFPKMAGRIAYLLFSTPRSRAKHRISDEVLEQAKLFELLYGKEILKAYEWGSGDKTILLVHGWESRGTALRSFVPALVEKGYRVVAFDGPAHGNSGGSRTNLPNFAGAIKAVINHIGGVHGIICHSFGGASTAYMLWNLKPELRLEKLILVAVPNRMTLVLETAAVEMNLSPKAIQSFKKVLESKISMPLETARIDQLQAGINVTDALIVHDTEDPIVPFSGSEQLFEKWNNASLLKTTGLGHFKIMKHPELIEKVADFIDQD